MHRPSIGIMFSNDTVYIQFTIVNLLHFKLHFYYNVTNHQV